MKGYWNTYSEIVCDDSVKIERHKQKKFNSSTNIISILYEQCLNQRVKGLWKIRLNLTDRKDTCKVFLPDKISATALIHKSFDFDHYFARNKLERRKILLETLYEAIVALCKKAGYDVSPFKAAYDKVKQLNYENRYIYGKMTCSPDRKYKAGIEIEVNEEAAFIAVVFTKNDKNNTQRNKITILKTQPHFMFIYRFIHKGKWIDSQTYRVSDKSGQVHFTVSLSGSEADIQLKPKKHTQKELIEALDMVKVA